MTTKHNIIWINNKGWKRPWQYLIGDDWLVESNFWKIYVWYILFTVLWATLFYISKYINHFNNVQVRVMYIGYIFGISLLGFFDYFYHYLSTRYVDKTSKKIYKTRVSLYHEDDYILLEDKENILKIKNFKANDAYAFQADYIHKLAKEGKIKIISGIEKMKSNKIPEDQEAAFFDDVSAFWELLQQHRKVTLITLLSLAYVIAYWNFHKLRKIFPWISVIFSLLLILQGYYLVWTKKYYYINNLYFFRKIQEIITALSIISVLIYINL